MKPGKQPAASSKNDHHEICNLDCKNPKKKVKDEKKRKQTNTEEKKGQKGKSDTLHDHKDNEEIFPQIHTFRGPVRVVVVDQPDDPTRDCKITASAFIALANLAIGANFIIFVLNTMGFIYSTPINVHVILCALGAQVFLPLSILIHHPLYGASGPLSESERTWAHCKFLVMTVICVGVGEYFGYDFFKKPKGFIANLAEEKLPYNRLHRTFGVIATFVFVLALLTGIAMKVLNIRTIQTDNNMEPKFVTFVNISHTVFGFATLLAGNVCFAISLFAPLFQTYMYYNSYLAPTVIMIILVSLYTVIMMVIRGTLHKY